MKRAKSSASAPIFPSENVGIRKTELYRNILMQSGLLIKKEAILKAGGYDSSFSIFDDHDLWLKIGKDWPIYDFCRVLICHIVSTQGGITMERRLKTAREGIKILFKYKKYYPGFFIGFFVCVGRFFISKMFVFWFRTLFART